MAPQRHQAAGRLALHSAHGTPKRDGDLSLGQISQVSKDDHFTLAPG